MNFTDADFSPIPGTKGGIDADMSQSVFIRADFRGMLVSGKAYGADFTNANFAGAIVGYNDVYFANTDFTGANFSGARLVPGNHSAYPNSRFKGANFTNAIIDVPGRAAFDKSDFTNANFTRARVSAAFPSVPFTAPPLWMRICSRISIERTLPAST